MRKKKFNDKQSKLPQNTVFFVETLRSMFRSRRKIKKD